MFNQKATILIFFTLLSLKLKAQNISINNTGTSPHSSAMLDVSSSSKGVLIPRITQSERNAISTPANGLFVYQTSAPIGFYVYDSINTTWNHILDSNMVASLILSLVTGDNLGDHSATQNIKLNGKYLSNDGGNEGALISNSGLMSLYPSNLGAGNIALDAWADIRTRGNGTGIYFTNSSIGITGNNSNTGDLRILTGGNTRISIGATGNVTINGLSTLNQLNIANEFTFPQTDGTSGQVLQTDGSGNVTWQTASGSGVQGNGTSGYLSAWTASDTLTNSIIQDDGSTIGVGSAPISFSKFYTLETAADVSAAIYGQHSIVASNTTYGVYGVSRSTDKNNAAGVYGSASNGAYAIYGQQQSSDANVVAVNGWNPSGGSNQNYGVKGQTSSSHPSSAGLYGFAFHGGNAILASSNARVIEANSYGTRTSGFNAVEINNNATSTTASIDKVGLNISSTTSWTGTNAKNIGLSVNTSGGTTNYSALFSGGNVGIGISDPTSMLHVADEITIEDFNTTGQHTMLRFNPTENPFLLRYVYDAVSSVPDSTFQFRASGAGGHNIAFTEFDNKVFLFMDASTNNVAVGSADPSSMLDVAGDVEVGSADAFYMGDPNTDGTWRMIRSGNDLNMERRESGVWVMKMQIQP